MARDTFWQYFVVLMQISQDHFIGLAFELMLLIILLRYRFERIVYLVLVTVEPSSSTSFSFDLLMFMDSFNSFLLLSFLPLISSEQQMVQVEI